MAEGIEKTEPRHPLAVEGVHWIWCIFLCVAMGFFVRDILRVFIAESVAGYALLVLPTVVVLFVLHTPWSLKTTNHLLCALVMAAAVLVSILRHETDGWTLLAAYWCVHSMKRFIRRAFVKWI